MRTDEGATIDGLRALGNHLAELDRIKQVTQEAAKIEARIAETETRLRLLRQRKGTEAASAKVRRQLARLRAERSAIL